MRAPLPSDSVESAFNVAVLGADKTAYIVDSGASHHMCNDLVLLEDVVTIPKRIVTVGNGGTLSRTKVGTLHLGRAVFPGVMFVPGLHTNLLSVGATHIPSPGGWRFSTHSATLYDESENAMITAWKRNGLYHVKTGTNGSDTSMSGV